MGKDEVDGRLPRGRVGKNELLDGKDDETSQAGLIVRKLCSLRVKGKGP